MEADPENPDPTSLNSEASPLGEAQGLQPLGLKSLSGRPISWRFLLARLVLLAGVVGLAGLVAWVWNQKQHGLAGAELAIFSMLVCGGSAGAALLLVGCTVGGPHAFAGLMGSILFRTLVPMGLGVVWHETHPNWPVMNVVEIHVPLFLVSLTVETILVVDIVSNSSPGSFLGKGRASRKLHG